LLQRLEVGERAVARDELLEVGLDVGARVEAPAERGKDEREADDAAGVGGRRAQRAAAGGRRAPARRARDAVAGDDLARAADRRADEVPGAAEGGGRAPGAAGARA